MVARADRERPAPVRDDEGAPRLRRSAPKSIRGRSAVVRERDDDARHVELGLRLADRVLHVVEHGERHLQHGKDERLVAVQVLAGGCQVSTDKGTMDVPVGELILVSTARPFTFEWTGNIACTFVYFEPELLGLPLRALPGLTGSWQARRTPAGNIAADVLRSASANLDAFNGATGQLLTHNVIAMLRTALIDEVTDIPANSRQLRFTQVAAYIDEHIGDPELSVRSIAQAHFVSLRTLHAIFQSQSTTAAAWIRTRRLEFAGRMLRDPALASSSIGDIAVASGFESASYFSVAFRAHFGVSPSQWRRADRPLLTA